MKDRDERVQAMVGDGGRVLDAAAVAAAGHADPRVVRAVELRPRLTGDVVDQRARVPAFDRRLVDSELFLYSEHLADVFNQADRVIDFVRKNIALIERLAHAAR